MRLHAVERALGLSVLATFLFLWVQDSAPVERLRNLTFDIYQQAHPRVLKDPDKTPVAIVAIDERSLGAVGGWPWPRDVVAKVVDALIEAGAGVVALDMVFAEEASEGDGVLAAAIKGRPVVVGRFVSDGTLDQPATMPKARPVLMESDEAKAYLPAIGGITFNVPAIEKAAAGAGLVVVDRDAGGVTRRMPLAFVDNGTVHPAFVSEVLRVAAGQDTMTIAGREVISHFRFTEKFGVPTDRHGAVWPRFVGSLRDRYISAVDVLSGTFPKDRVKGRIVFVGATAPGIPDFRAGPLGESLPGVEFHAQTVDAILKGEVLNRSVEALAIEFFLLLCSGLVLIVLLPIIERGWVLPLFLGLLGGVVGVSWGGFMGAYALIDATLAAGSLIVIYVLMTYGRMVVRPD